MAELQRKKQKSVGTVCKDAIMTGISYMIPVIVGGGVITAIAKMMGGYNIGDTAAEMQTLAQGDGRPAGRTGPFRRTAARGTHQRQPRHPQPAAHPDPRRRAHRLLYA